MSPASAVSSQIPNMGNSGSSLTPGSGLEPGMQTQPAKVLQVDKQVQEKAAPPQVTN